MKVWFSQIRDEYELMRKDFRSNDCTIRLYRGMKTRGYSAHDVDIIVTMRTKKSPIELEGLCRKWDKYLLDKFGVTLDCLIQRRDKNHIYDYDHRCGICDAEARVCIAEGRKRIDGKWVRIESH